ncbi:MAG: hypothetical protein PHO98_10565 [Synergistaceae bacterium]|jgi:hypothetical protein|nr:hypothetical protein [Synergistaceae bacterium]
MEKMVHIIGSIVLGVSISALVVTPVVQFLCSIAADFRPSCSMAYKASFSALLGCLASVFIVGDILDASGAAIIVNRNLPGLLAAMPVEAYIFGRLIRHPVTGGVGFVNGYLISAIVTLLGYSVYLGIKMLAAAVPV